MVAIGTLRIMGELNAAEDLKRLRYGQDARLTRQQVLNVGERFWVLSGLGHPKHETYCVTPKSKRKRKKPKRLRGWVV